MSLQNIKLCIQNLLGVQNFGSIDVGRREYFSTKHIYNRQKITTKEDVYYHHHKISVEMLVNI